MIETDIQTVLQQIPKMLIVEDDSHVREFLRSTIMSWDIEVAALASPSLINKELSHLFYNIALLDIRLSQKSGLEVIPLVRKISPDTKIIMMSGFAQTESIAQALRLGVTDFLKKPIEQEFLYHSIKQALQLQATELELCRAFDELDQIREELLLNEAKLKKANQQLIETNSALSVLNRNIERTRSETEFQISRKIKTAIIPLVEKLHNNSQLKDFHADLHALMDILKNMMRGLEVESPITQFLSGTEFKIAYLIKNGLTTDEIADHFCVSPYTIKSHRRKIRKKLNLNNSKQNLRNYLKASLETN